MIEVLLEITVSILIKNNLLKLSSRQVSSILVLKYIASKD